MPELHRTRSALAKELGMGAPRHGRGRTLGLEGLAGEHPLETRVDLNGTLELRYGLQGVKAGVRRSPRGENDLPWR